MKFTFRDCKGHLYQSESGAEYGILTPVSTSTTTLSCSRPHAFSSGTFLTLSTAFQPGELIFCTLPLDTSSTPPPRRPPHKQKSTFKDILPSNLITTSSLSEKNPDRFSSTRSGTVKAVRRSVLPKIQGVVHNLRRSVTSIHAKRPTFFDEMVELERDETRGLVRSGSPSSIGSDIRRSAILATARTKYSPS